MRFLALLLTSAIVACATNGAAGADPTTTPVSAAVGVRVDSARLLTDIRVLSADSMQGRRPGTPGSERARRYLQHRYQEIGLATLGESFQHPFEIAASGQAPARQGINFVGLVRGTEHPERYIVVTAHYDHVGFGRAVNGDSLYNGADDNASGTAALLALAEWFHEHPPRTSMLFVALDAEEGGLRGARAFVSEPPVPLDAIVMNVNMDMVSRNDRNELYAAGTHHYPFLAPLVDRVAAAAPVTLRRGHDLPGTGHQDWTGQSDHAAFHAARIPFLYFGVEDHPDYHQPSDEFERIQPRFFVSAVETIGAVVAAVDREVESVMTSAGR